MTAEEERILAWTLLGEAANQGRTGMEAVAFVIRNRAASGRFPDNPASVALQSGQFSTWNPISQGGNIPRARYSADSSIFQTALSAVRKVFSDAPGKDPTQGATHYYAPKGMPGETAPYWWRGESSKAGDVRIGGHIFAAKYDLKEAPTPALRKGVEPIGYYPDKYQLENIRTGQPARLPAIAPPRETLAEQLKRENGGAVPKETVIMRYDPIKKEMVRTGSTVSARLNVEAQRKEQQAQRKTAVPSARQSVAGFSVPMGTTGIAVVDAGRKLTENAKAEVRRNELDVNQSHVERGTPRVQTQFAAPVAQPKGALVPKKDEARLEPSPNGLPVKVSASDLARGKSKPVAATPDMPRPRPVRVPVVVPTVQRQPVPAARKALAITVEGARTASVPQALSQSPVDALRAQGLSPQQAYDQANANAAATAIANAGGSSSAGASLSRWESSFGEARNRPGGI